MKSRIGNYNITRTICFLSFILLSLIFVAGCNDGNDSSTSTSTTTLVKQGIFVDSAVKGLTFETASCAGLTNAEGRFTYREGETITFFIGDVVLGQAKAEEILSPIDLVSGAIDETNSTVSNICRFLQSLDIDGNPDNGISITDEIINEVRGRTIDFTLSTEDFENDPQLQGLFDSLNALVIFSGDERVLCSSEDAQNHMRTTLYGSSTGDDDDSSSSAENNDPNENGDDPPNSTQESEYERQLREIINEYRLQNSLNVLNFDQNLYALAKEHSEDMYASGTLSHDGFSDRYERSGYGYAVENVGWNYQTPEAQFEGWKNSPGHNQNMLNPNIEYVGISKVGSYVTFLACGN